jgi:hypothetical protein
MLSTQKMRVLPSAPCASKNSRTLPPMAADSGTPCPVATCLTSGAGVGGEASPVVPPVVVKAR